MHFRKLRDRENSEPMFAQFRQRSRRRGAVEPSAANFERAPGPFLAFAFGCAPRPIPLFLRAPAMSAPGGCGRRAPKEVNSISDDAVRLEWVCG
jgi:hypothetical protein